MSLLKKLGKSISKTVKTIANFSEETVKGDWSEAGKTLTSKEGIKAAATVGGYFLGGVGGAAAGRWLTDETYRAFGSDSVKVDDSAETDLAAEQAEANKTRLNLFSTSGGAKGSQVLNVLSGKRKSIFGA